MFDELLTKIFGSRNDRLIKQYRRKCDAINKLEPQMQALTDEQTQAETTAEPSAQSDEPYDISGYTAGSLEGCQAGR